MTIDEKLSHFYDVTIEDAQAKAAGILEEHRKALAQMTEKHKADSQENAQVQIKAETANARREINKALSAEQLTIKRDWTKKQNELKEKLFAEVKTQLENFRNLRFFRIYQPLHLHLIIQLAAPPFLSYLIHRHKGIFMSHFNTVCKNLYLIDSIMIGFRHCEKRIHNLGIFGICHIIIHVFLIDHFFNIRRIGKIIDQSCIYFNLTVNTFPGLFQNG